MNRCIIKTIDKPATFVELQRKQTYILTPLAKYLVADVHHPALVAALMALKGHFTAIEDNDDQGINAARAAACEVVALRYTMRLSYREAIDVLLFELPPPKDSNGQVTTASTPTTPRGEQTPLLGTWRSATRSELGLTLDGSRTEAQMPDKTGSDLAEQLQGLNALEIAAVSGAKKFLSQRPIQRIINAIWNGDIIFWSNLRFDGTKHPQIYQRNSSDPYCRLRVPKYLKAFEVLFFAGFLIFYYVVLIQRPFHYVSAAEVLLYVWLAAFGYNGIIKSWRSLLDVLTSHRVWRVLGCRNGFLSLRLLDSVGRCHRGHWCCILHMPHDWTV